MGSDQMVAGQAFSLHFPLVSVSVCLVQATVNWESKLMKFKLEISDIFYIEVHEGENFL